MKTIQALILMLFSQLSLADRIGQYMTVANNISRMEMKADAEAQAWVRSARNVLLLTSESIWESLSLVNENSPQQLFCIPKDTSMTAEAMTDLIKSSYQQLTMPETEKNQFTVAKVALLGLEQKYPCGPKPTPQVTLQHHGQSPVQKMMHMGKIAGLM